MGTAAPDGYLVCDGTVYNISDYPLLANHFETQFQTKNHFGGDGITTFAVPDLRGEFLRGTGTNSHTNQGSGLNVGMHQDGTIHHMTNSNEQNCIIATDKIDYINTSNRDWVQQQPIRIVSAT